MQKVKKILFRLLMYSLLFFVALIIFVFTYFLFNKDEIAENLLLGMNENINGEVNFTDIYLDPFAQFPHISLALEDFSLFEKEETERTILEDPVAEFEDAFIAFDVFDLIGERIVITKMLFTNGYIDIIKYQNSLYNYEIALGKKKSAPGKKKQVKKKKKKKSESSKITKKSKKKRSFISKNLMLNLNRISFTDVHLEHNNQKDGSQYNVFIYSMISSISIMPDTIKVGLYTKAEFKDLQVLKNTMFENLLIESNSKLNYSRNDSVLQIKSGKLILSRAEFRINGALALKEKGFINLKIRGADKKLGFLNRLLSKSGLENLKTGNFFFKGSLKGSFEDEIPSLNLDFGIKDLSMQIPGEKDSIKNFNMSGSFASGNENDLSSAVLKIDTLKAILPGGFLDAEFQMKDFSAPDINYQVLLQAKVRGFEKIVRQHFIDSLDGQVNIKSEFKANFGPEFSSMKVKKSNLSIQLDSVSFKIPGLFNIEHLGGLISGDHNRLKLKNIQLNSKNSDIKMSGSFSQLSNLIKDNKKRMFARLSLKSNMLNISDYFSDSSTVGSDFNYKFSKIDFSLSASAKKSELFEFEYVPKVAVSIHKLNAKIDSVLKPLNLLNARVSMTDYADGYLINFNNLLVKAAKGNVFANINYQKENNGKAKIKIKADMKRVKLNDVFDKAVIDSAALFYATPFNAQLNCNLSIKESKFRQFELQFDKINYKWENNRVQLNNVALKSKGFYFKNNSLKDLVGRFNLKIGEIKTKYYNFKKVVYSIATENKKFTIVPENDSILGVKAEGKLIASPYELPPAYSLDYTLKQFSVGQMFVNFLEDSVLSGRADFYMNLNFKGHNEAEILESLDGRIRMRGNNLTLYGADLDKFIDGYRKTQSLNLLDVGLTIYAGPIGLFTTKKAGFARVKVTNRKKKSSIDRMISDWKIIGDSLIIDDVALRTKQNRLALKGWYSYSSDSLDFKIGLLNAKGCSDFKQGFSGPSTKPVMDNSGLFNLQPQKKTEKECKVFYKGKLDHPVKK